MVKVNVKCKQNVKAKVLNADQISDLGPIKKGDRGYLNTRLTKGEKKKATGYLGMPPFQPYMVVDCRPYSPPLISGKSCIRKKETTLRVVLSEDYQKYMDSHPAIARVRHWDIEAKYFNKIPQLTRSVGTKLRLKGDSPISTSNRKKEFEQFCKNKNYPLKFKKEFGHFCKNNSFFTMEECEEYWEERDREDPDCPYYANHAWYDWFGRDACGEGKWRITNLKIDSGSVKTKEDEAVQFYSPNDPNFDPDLFLTGEYPRVGGIDMGGIEGLGRRIPWIKAPKGYKNTSGMKQLNKKYCDGWVPEEFIKFQNP